MKAEDKLKVIDKIIGVWVEWYSDDKDVEHGMMVAISAVLAIEEDNYGPYCATDVAAESVEQEG